MKKLLTILSSFAIIASTGALVIACDTKINRFGDSDVKLKDAIYTKVIAKALAEDSELGGILTGDMFFDIDFKTTILKMIDEIIAGLDMIEQEKKLNSSLGLVNNELESNNSGENSLEPHEKLTNDIMNDMTSTKFFNEYTASLTSGSSKDWEIWNTTKELNGTSLETNGQYVIYYQEHPSGADQPTGGYLRWQIPGEFGTGTDGVKEQIPTIETLTNTKAKFYLVNKTQSGIGSTLETLPDQKVELSNSEVLSYRFQKYFRSNLQTDLYDDLLAVEYTKERLLDVTSNASSALGKSVKIKNTNEIVKVTQKNAPYDVVNTTSQLKMVWSFRFSKDKGSSLYSKIHPDLQEDGTLKDYTNGSIINIFDKLPEAENKADNGSDPFFGKSGFNGFVKNTTSSSSGEGEGETGTTRDGSKTVESVLGNLTISEAAKTEVAKATKPIILTGPQNSGFDSTRTNFQEYVLVLPIYLNDLFTTEFTKPTISESTKTITLVENNWFDLSTIDQNIKDKPISIDNGNNLVLGTNNTLIKSTTTNEDSGTLRIGEDHYTIKTISKNESKTLGVTEELAITDKNKEIFGETNLNENDTFTYNINWTNKTNTQDLDKLWKDWIYSKKSSNDIRSLSADLKKELLSQISLIASNNDVVKENAKTALYSEYLENSDNIKYQALYDEIAKYIKEDSNEDWD